MTLKVLPASGPITITAGAIAAGVIIVGSGDVLADHSDTTFVEGDPSPHQVNAELALLDSYDSGDPIAAHIRLSLESTGHGGVDSQVFIFLQDGHPADDSGSYYVGQFTTGGWNSAATFPPPFDGSIREMVLPLVVAPGFVLSDCVAVLESGTAQLAVNALTVLDAGFVQAGVRLYEAWVEVGLPLPVITGQLDSTRIRLLG